MARAMSRYLDYDPMSLGRSWHISKNVSVSTMAQTTLTALFQESLGFEYNNGPRRFSLCTGDNLPGGHSALSLRSFLLADK